MNSVPRVDSPKSGPMHSTMMDDHRLLYTPRMLMNEAANPEPSQALVCV